MIMAENKTEATTYGCDAPKCDVVHVVVGEDRPKGRRLVSEGPDGTPVKAYACRATHIRPAIEEAEERAAREASEVDTDAQFADAKAQGMTSHADGVRVADADDEALEELERAGEPVAVGQ
jgi:hypothetical protein